MHLLQSTLILLASWRSCWLFVNGCSVLPGGSPMCFTDAIVPEEKPEAGKEITFESKSRDITAYYVINNRVKDDFRLGSGWQLELGTEHDLFECYRDLTEGAYSKEFEIESYSLPLKRDKNNEYDYSMNKAALGENFVITKKEVWNCVSQKQDDTLTPFYRVVTELLTKNPIGIIYVSDGFEVKTIPCPTLPQQNTESAAEKDGKYTAVIREVKYLDKFTKKKLRYDGLLKLYEHEKSKGKNPSMFKLVSEQQEQEKDDYHRIKIEDGCKTKIFNSKEDDSVIEVRTFKGNIIGSEESESTCCLNNKIGYRLTSIGLPTWSESRRRMNGPSSNSDKEIGFLKNFIVMKEELWACQVEGGPKFTKKVIEFVGKENIDRFEYFDESKVWQYKLGDSSQSVAIRAVYYYNTENKESRYKGWIKSRKFPSDCYSEGLQCPKRKEFQLDSLLESH